MEGSKRPGLGAPGSGEKVREEDGSDDRRPIQGHMEPHGTVHGQTDKRTIHCIGQVRYTYLRAGKGIT